MTFEQLFSQGKQLSIGYIKVYYRVSKNSSFATQVGFACPKALHKNAVDRNRIKRRMRESWRLHKYMLSDITNREVSIQLVIVYQNNMILTYQEINNIMIKIIEQLQSIITPSLNEKSLE